MRLSYFNTLAVILAVSAVPVRAAAIANAVCTDPQPVTLCCTSYVDITSTNSVLSGIFGEGFILPGVGSKAGVGCMPKTSMGCPPFIKEANCVFYNPLLAGTALPCEMATSSSGPKLPGFK